MNNYDMSSTGINIELNVGYDLALAEENRNEYFEDFEDDYYTYVYTPLREPSKIVCVGDLLEVTIPSFDISDDILINEFYYDEDHTEDFSYERIWEEVLYNIDMRDMHKYIEILDKYKVSYIKLYDEVIDKGYNYDDTANVIIPHYLRKDLGLEEDADLVEIFKQDIHSVLWDIPISASITINGVTYWSNIFNGLYEVDGGQCWDKDVFIKEVIEEFNIYNKEVLFKELTKLVPDELEI